VVRDDERHEHDLLVPWTQLPEEARDIDRRMVRARPSILAGAGFRLARDPAREELARRLHERYLATKLRRGETAEHLGGWSELTEEVREQNRLVVDHIAVKLARVGCRSVPRTLGRFNMAEFTDAEAERMAELEHERWVAERLARGWKRGTRDDGARFHPDLVDWRDLTEEAREKDRDVVRAIPGLLASAGYMVIRDS